MNLPASASQEELEAGEEAGEGNHYGGEEDALHEAPEDGALGEGVNQRHQFAETQKRNGQ